MSRKQELLARWDVTCQLHKIEYAPKEVVHHHVAVALVAVMNEVTTSLGTKVEERRSDENVVVSCVA